MSLENNNIRKQITGIGFILVSFIAVMTCTIILFEKQNFENLNSNISKQTEYNKTDYQIKLNSDNTINLISKDTIRKIDFYELEEVILQDNI